MIAEAHPETGPLARLLEERWDGRGDAPNQRELGAEVGAAVLLVAAAAGLALAGAEDHLPSLWLTAGLVGLYAIFSCAITIPIGSGSAVPSWLVLVPMLLLLPPALVPALAAHRARARHRGAPPGRAGAAASRSCSPWPTAGP